MTVCEECDKERKDVYLVGFNVPGYLPTMEPVECETWEDARACLVDYLRAHANDLADGDDLTANEADTMVALDYAANDIETLQKFPEPSCVVTCGGVEYWVHLEKEG